MSKKITLGVIGFIGVGLLFFAPVTHAAAIAAPDAQTRALLGQTLSVLRVTLDQIDARIGSKTNPIEDPLSTSASLEGIKSGLVAIDAYLKSAAPAASEGGSPLAENSPAAAYGTVPQTATVSWFVGPKLLFILLPVILLALTSFALLKKRAPKEIKTETVSEAKAA